MFTDLFVYVGGWICTCHSMPVVRDLLAVIYSLFLPCGFQGPNADCHVYSKESLPSAPSHWSIKNVIYYHNSWKSWVSLNPEASSWLLSHCLSPSLHLSWLHVTVRGSCSNRHSPDTEQMFSSSVLVFILYTQLMCLFLRVSWSLGACLKNLRPQWIAMHCRIVSQKHKSYSKLCGMSLKVFNLCFKNYSNIFQI